MINAANKVNYKAFGLRIVSEIQMPELTPIIEQNDMVDIVIRKGDLTKLWSTIGKQGKFVVKENLVIFQVLNTATFCIEEGESVIVSPMNGVGEDKIRLYILGTCMSILLMQRKVLPLHGSAVAIDGKAYAIVGDSGAGKSTLASAFLSKGYQLLSDDVIAISLSHKKTPFVTPSYPQQKLWQESLNEFGMETVHYRPLFERETKYAVPVSTNFYTEPLPLAGVIELVKTENENIEIHSIEKLERLHTLFLQTFRNFLIPRLGLVGWHFAMSVDVINRIDMFQLQRPISRFTAHDLVSVILSSLNKEEYK